jgi:hypothetical protein
MKPWTEEENELLASLWQVEFSKCAHRFPGHSVKAVRQQAQVLGLSKPMWTQADERLLAELWPAMGSNCATAFPTRSKSAVRGKAQELGLKRSSKRRGLTFNQMRKAA